MKITRPEKTYTFFLAGGKTERRTYEEIIAESSIPPWMRRGVVDDCDENALLAASWMDDTA